MATTNKQVKVAVFGIKTPEGFTRKEERNVPNGYGGKHTQLVLESADIKIQVNLESMSGHVDFNTVHGWRTFDRRGVNDSFYIDIDKPTSADLDAQVTAQIEKARARIEEAKSSLAIPGFPFSCLLSPARVAEIKKDLKSGKSTRLAPGGMGTGYTLTTKRPRDRYGWVTAKPETCKFFDVPQLYLVSFDHD